jgi:Flp pilus assembly pilin Flp
MARAERDRALARDHTGAASVEYVVLLALVALVGSAATAALGLPLLRLFRYAEILILMPIP